MSSSETPKDTPPTEQPPAAESSSTAAAGAEGAKDEDSISFTVKSIADNKIPVTVNRFISVADLKQQLAEPSSIPADRQRLIYSGRVLKDDQTVDSYKIQNGHTVHLVKGAASNASAARGAVGGSSASTNNAGTAAGATGSGGATNPPPPQQLPSMAAGTGMNPLSRLTNHIPLPSADMFGPDGGMGPPPNPEQMLSMMEQPEVRASMNALLQNPALLESLIQSNPMLQAMGPDARRMMQSEEFRRMMTDPTIFRQMTQMQRALGMGPFGRGFGGAGGAGGGFPAPGVTDQTPTDQQTQEPQQQAGNGAAGAGAAGAPPINPFAALFNPFGAAAQAPPAPSTGGSPPPNPFLLFNPALFGGAQQQPPAGQTQTPGAGGEQAGAAGAGGATGQQVPPNPFNPFMPPGGGMDLNQLQNMMQILGMGPGGAGGFGGPGGFGSPPAPVDNRPPEERYADQLRQLNDMGFFDFDRNVTALRRTGGSVQGAVEYLLSNP